MKLPSYQTILKKFEHTLAGAALCAVFIVSLLSLYEFIQLDWTQFETFHLVLERILYLAIGIEVARLLLSYCLETLIELIAFVIARKILLVDADFLGVLVGVCALVILFGAKHYFYRTFEHACTEK